MIGYFAVEAKYAMKLDIYRVQISQDPNSGEIRRQWAYTETVPCLAKSIISTGVRSPSNVVGSTPIIDGFGQTLEYESTLQRSDIQNALT